MERIDEITKELNTLPSGYISKKKINGKQRYYLQFRDGKKIKSKYIKEDNLELIKNQLLQRKKLEDELVLLINNSIVPLGIVNDSVLSFNGDIMLIDDVVASFENGLLTYVDKERAPLYIVRTGDLKGWLEKRAIDSHRTNSRIVRKALRINTSSSIETVLRVHACTITDSYWYRPNKSKLKYDDVTYKNDLYYDVSLNGNFDSAPKVVSATPELTNTGSFEKCWKLYSDGWWMIKKGSKDEIFAEIFSSRLAKHLGIPSAEYELYEDKIRTKNFATSYNLETISSIAGDDDSYENVFNAIVKLNDNQILFDYIRLMWFDCLIHNVDRHNENLGLLRDKKNGKIICLAPNYDNNLALFATSIPKDLSRNKDGMINLFSKFLKSNKVAVSIFKSMSLPKIETYMIQDSIDVPLFDVHKELILDYIINGYNKLKEIHDNLQ